MGRTRSLYLIAEEDEALKTAASEKHTTANAVVRIAIRRLLGMPVPTWAEDFEPKENESA